MMSFFYLIPIALALGLAGLGAFMWSLKSGQYEDLDGAAERILFNEDDTPAASSRGLKEALRSTSVSAEHEGLERQH
jgi:cbb3-type cytochrome oxidase maturation protein